jgi:hypothetical protein
LRFVPDVPGAVSVLSFRDEDEAGSGGLEERLEELMIQRMNVGGLPILFQVV